VLDPVDTMFDPSQHEAISIQPTKDVAAGMVLAVIQKGYTLNNRVLRPARVVVAKAVE
jgi:molecular chaperone GrpE